MRAQRHNQREDKENFANADEHADKLNCLRRIASAKNCVAAEVTRLISKSRLEPPHVGCYDSVIQTSVPLGSRSKSGIKSASARWMQPCDAGRPMDFWSAVP